MKKLDITPKVKAAIEHYQKAKVILSKIAVLTWVISILASCSIKQVCNLDNQQVIITDYHKSIETYDCRNLTNTCYGSFRCYNRVNIGDTVTTQLIYMGSISANLLPVCNIKK
jgi:hypothetical protein